ncbi:hypothetical protein [Tenacibaculum sp. E3R01]|uniref:hypothetical protein n=1 Tax=Tenacibaculum sp. E3R01 TaxID=2267227 RepID=UPI0011BF3DA2|nr:hypothetical protein [Tenacibaculum sp. E3R01]
MRKTSIFFIMIFSLLFVSCKTKSNEKAKAELTFKSISFMSAYGATDKELNDLNKKIDDVLLNKRNEIISEEEKLYQYFGKLRNLNLLEKPYIFLRFNKDSILPVYLSENEFNKVKNFKQIDLFKEGKKVIIELDLVKKNNTIYYSNNIVSIIKVNGRSHSNGN